MTLNKQEWDEIEHLVNGEYMTQVEDAGFHAALTGVKLAMTVLQSCPIQNKSLVKLRQQALEYLSQFGNYEESPIKDILTKEDLHTLHVKKYGSEEEAIAQERYEALGKMLMPAHNDHVRLWYQDAQAIWHLLESSKEDTRWKFYYDEGKSRSHLLVTGTTDYRYGWIRAALFHEVKEQLHFDVYAVPTEQWIFSPDVKES